MQDHNINSPELSTSTDNFLDPFSLEIPMKDTSRIIRGHEECADDTDIFTAWLFGLIEVLSVKKGYCYMHDKSFALKLKCSERTIQRCLNSLEDKGWIYRNTYNTKKGRTRHIVCRFLYANYWRRFLSRPVIPDSVKKDFIKKTYPKSHTTPQSVPPPKTEPPDTDGECIYATDTDVECLLLHNTEDNTENNNDEGSAAVFSFADEVKKELSKAGYSKYKIQIALDYYKAHPEMLKKVAKPIGWLRTGLKDGWLEEMVTNPITLEDKHQQNWDQNKAKAQEIEKLHFTDAKQQGIRINALNKHLEFVTTSSQCQPIVLEYSDVLFDKNLQTTLEKIQLIGKNP